MIAVTICSTRSYAYALIAQARKVVACIEREPKGVVILVGDNSPQIQKAKEFYESVLPGAGVPTGRSERDEGVASPWRCELITGKFEDGLKNYKNPAQLIIARMRSIAFDRARQLQADLCWSLDSDVLPPPNALRVMKQMLEFDDRFYSVSTCPYPSQGGGPFLGGRGTPERPILPDFYDDEREIPDELQKRMKECQERLKKLKGRPDAKWLKEHSAISEEVKKCRPIGDPFFVNSHTGLKPFIAALESTLPKDFPKNSDLPKKVLDRIKTVSEHYSPKGYRRRGWLPSAYPGIGIGAVVPTDWCGFGCTLMSRRALSLAQFDGYDGSGTEDLYVVWKRWHRHGLKINVIPHSPCDHVIRDRQRKGKFILCQAFHESKEPEFVGHLRIEPRPWYQQTEGEKFNADRAKK